MCLKIVKPQFFVLSYAHQRFPWDFTRVVFKSEIFSYGILKKNRTIDQWNKRFQHRQGFRRLRIHLLQSIQDGKEDEDLGGSEGRGMGESR